MMKSIRIFQFITLSLFGSLLFILSGCQNIESLVGSLKQPSAEITGARFENFSLSAIDLIFDVKVKNPYSVPLPLVNVDYGLTTSGQQFLTGAADLQSSIPAGQAKTLSVPAKIDFLEVLKSLQEFKPGSVIPYTADLGLSVNAPGIGPLRLPLKKEGKLPIPTAPDVRLEEIKWEELMLSSAKGILKLKVVNQNEFPMDLSNLSYVLSLAGTKVASTGIEQGITFAESGGAHTLDIPISFSPQNLGLAAFRILTGKGTGYKLDGEMDVNTPFGALPLPLKSAGNVLFNR